MGCQNDKPAKCENHNNLIKKKAKNDHQIFKIVLLGESSVGKSCLMERVCNNRFSED